MNVVVIAVDSLRADHLGCYGSHVQMPHIDRLAEEGTVLLNAVSEGLPTLPTRMSRWTGCVSFVDKWVGALSARQRDLGLWDTTLLMLTSNHGVPFGEHGYIRKARPHNHEQLIHIPWIVRHPVGIGAGRRVDVPVQMNHLMPQCWMRWGSLGR